MIGTCETFLTHITFMWFLTSVCHHMLSEITSHLKKIDDGIAWANRLRLGLYYYHLKHTLAAGFKMNQIHVIRLEDYSVNKTSVLAAAFDFLGLNALSKIQMTTLLDLDIAENANKDHSPVNAMFDSTRQLLDNFYREANDKLADLMKDPSLSYR